MEFLKESKQLAANITQAAAHVGEKMLEEANQAIHSQYANAVLAGATLAAAAAGRGAIGGLVEKSFPLGQRLLAGRSKLLAEVSEVSELSMRPAFSETVLQLMTRSNATRVGFVSKELAMENYAAATETSFAARTGWRSTKPSSGSTFALKYEPGQDKNGEVFQQEIADQMGIDLRKMNEGKISILHPRFRHPEKQLNGNATGRDLDLWGNDEQGVGVAEYETLPSRKGYLKSAQSVVRIASQDKGSLPDDFANHIGSGVFIGRPNQGLILTNRHVVDDSTALSIKTLDGKKFSASILDIDREQDLALVRINNAPAESTFTPVKFTQSKLVARSTRVAALGHAGGLPGLVASPGRYLFYHESLKLDVLAVDSMNHGQSGGGIFGQDGRMVSLMAKRLEAVEPGGKTWNPSGGINIKHIREYLAKNNVLED